MTTPVLTSTTVRKRNHGDHTGSRVRTSETALRIALKAAAAEGMVVDKLCVSGGYIEVHVRHIEGSQPQEEDDGLEKW